MKNTIVCLSLFTVSLLHSQSKVVDFQTEKTLIEHAYLANGGVYLQFGNLTDRSGTTEGKNMIVLSENLEKKLDYDFSDNTVFSKALLTPTGKINGFYKYTSQPNEREEEFKNSDIYYLSATDKKKYDVTNNAVGFGDLKEIIRGISTDSYQIYIGKKIRRKDNDIKNGTDYKGLMLYRKDLKSGESKMAPLTFPTQEYPDGIVYYQYQYHTNEKVFYTLNKLQDDDKKNVCRLVSFDYNGKMIDNIPFTLELPDKTHFIKSHYDSESKYEGYNNNNVPSVFVNEAATVDVKIAPDGKSFYTYGIYMSKRAVVFGYYIYKYDFTGKELWHLVNNNVNEKDKQKYSPKTKEFDLFFKNNKTIGFWCHKAKADERTLFEIDSDKGTILQTRIGKITGDERGTFDDQYNPFGLPNSLTYIENKTNTKVSLDENTIYAVGYNSQVEKYVENAKKGTRFETYMCENGIYMIEYNKKENHYSVLKFDW